MRTQSPQRHRAQRLAPLFLIAACLSLAGCRQWASHDHASHDHVAQKRESDIPKIKKPAFDLDSLRDERAVAVDRHMNGKSRRANLPRSVADKTSSSPIDEDPANSYLPATELESKDP